jgi:hypothetical protein
VIEIVDVFTRGVDAGDARHVRPRMGRIHLAVRLGFVADPKSAPVE